jgi:hypothetical protein
MRLEWIFYHDFTGGFEIWRTRHGGLVVFCYLSPEFQHGVLAGF